MVRTRKSAKEPRELQLEETPPETNGYHLNFANGDTESMVYFTLLPKIIVLL